MPLRCNSLGVPLGTPTRRRGLLVLAVKGVVPARPAVLLLLLLHSARRLPFFRFAHLCCRHLLLLKLVGGLDRWVLLPVFVENLLLLIRSLS